MRFSNNKSNRGRGIEVWIWMVRFMPKTNLIIENLKFLSSSLLWGKNFQCGYSGFQYTKAISFGSSVGRTGCNMDFSRSLGAVETRKVVVNIIQSCATEVSIRRTDAECARRRLVEKAGSMNPELYKQALLNRGDAVTTKRFLPNTP